MDYKDYKDLEDNDDSDNSSEFARVNRVMLPKSSEEYRQRRERNNAAVKKSRFKSKQKTLETQKRVDQLKSENSDLERRVESLNRELNFMRAIFVPRRDSQQQVNHHQHSGSQVPPQQALQNSTDLHNQRQYQLPPQLQDENNITGRDVRYTSQ